MCCVRKVSSPTPLVRTRGFRRLVSGGRGFKWSFCPDSGATVDIVPMEMVKKYGLKYDEDGAQGIKLLDAKGENMSVLGSCRFYVVPKGCKKKRMVTALVSGDLEGEPLLGWQTMKLWCLLSKMFPKVEEYDDIPDENEDKVKSVRDRRVDFSLNPGSAGADSTLDST